MNLQLKKMFRRTETNQTNLTQAAFLYNVLVLKEITQKGYLHWSWGVFNATFSQIPVQQYIHVHVIHDIVCMITLVRSRYTDCLIRSKKSKKIQALYEDIIYIIV